jgi:lysophospholipase L1-like esterase
MRPIFRVPEAESTESESDSETEGTTQSESDSDSENEQEFLVVDEWVPERVIIETPRRVYVLTDSLLAGTEQSFREAVIGSVTITPLFYRGARLYELERIVCQILRDTDAPVVIVVCAGGNDIFPRRDRRRPAPLSHRNCSLDGDRLARPALDSIGSLVNLVQYHHNSSRLLLGTVPPRFHLSPAEVIAHRIINREVISWHRTQHCRPVFLDRFVTRSRHTARRNRLNSRDGIHPRPQTTRRFVEEILLRIREALEEFE